MRVFGYAPPWGNSIDKLDIWTKIEKFVNITMYAIVTTHIQLHVPSETILDNTYQVNKVCTETHVSNVVQNVHLIVVKY
jgi:hypothetical protein